MFLSDTKYSVNTHEFGNLRVVIFDFPNADDTLPMHNHKLGGAHISVVARGSFLAKGPGWEKELPLGAVVDWDENQWHEFIASEPNSRLVNVVKKEGYI